VRAALFHEARVGIVQVDRQVTSLDEPLCCRYPARKRPERPQGRLLWHAGGLGDVESAKFVTGKGLWIAFAREAVARDTRSYGDRCRMMPLRSSDLACAEAAQRVISGNCRRHTPRFIAAEVADGKAH